MTPSKKTVVFATILMFWHALEAAEPAARKVKVHIDAAELPNALIQLTEQADLQLIYPANVSPPNLPAPRLSGSFSMREALERLLKDSGLSYEFISDRTIAIVPNRRKETGASGASSQESLRLAQAERPSGQIVTDARNEAVNEADEKATAQGIPEILVKGERSLNTEIRRTEDDIQHYVVFDRETIGRSGAVNLEEFFKNRLTMGTNSPSNSQQTSLAGSTSQVNLRGLGAEETLILVDGRRIAGFSVYGTPTQPDINSIPLSAIERIEILPSSASGIYGGGATGGAINIIMRRNYSGLESQLTYDNSFSSDSARRRIDANGGFSFENGRSSVLLAASWSDANTLLVRERDLRARSRALIFSNNPGAALNATPQLGATTNISSVTGAPLTLRNGTAVGSAFTHVPYGYAGPASDQGAAFRTAAGRHNLDLADTAQSFGGARQSMINAPTTHSFSGTLRREFTPDVDAFLELNGARNSGSFAGNQARGVFVIPGSSAANPFQENIRVTTPTLGADEPFSTRLETYRAAAGVAIRLPRNWVLGVDYTWNESRFASSAPRVLDSGRALAAINGGTLDIFRDTNIARVDFSPYLFRGIEFLESSTTLDNATVRLSGPLPLSLPGGAPTLSARVERRNEKLGDFYLLQPLSPSLVYQDLYPNQSQRVDSVYAELQIPLVSAGNGIRGIRSLDLQLAARHDRYRIDSAAPVPVDDDLQPLLGIERARNTLSSTDPTVALRFKPVEDLTFRTSYGTGFLPPSVSQLAPVSGVLVVPGSDYSVYLDPRRGNEPLGALGNDITVYFDGADNLAPEQSTSWSAGLILTPRFASGLRVSVDWTRIRKRDNIIGVFQFMQSDFDNEQYVPGLIVRNPAAPGDPYGVGPIVGIDAGLFNISKLEMEAFDYDVTYDLETAASGAFQLSLAATQMMSLKSQITPTSPVRENAGVGSAGNVEGTSVPGGGGLKWKANATVTWRKNAWTLGWTTRFFDGYFVNTAHTVDLNQGSATVPSQTYNDLFGSILLGKYSGPLLSIFSGAELSFGVKNLFDRRPPVDVAGLGPQFGLTQPGYSYFGDPRMSSYHLSFRKAIL